MSTKRLIFPWKNCQLNKRESLKKLSSCAIAVRRSASWTEPGLMDVLSGCAGETFLYVMTRGHLEGHPHQRRIAIYGRIATHFNGNSFAQFGTNSHSSPVWMGLHGDDSCVPRAVTKITQHGRILNYIRRTVDCKAWNRISRMVYTRVRAIGRTKQYSKHLFWGSCQRFPSPQLRRQVTCYMLHSSLFCAGTNVSKCAGTKHGFMSPNRN